MTSDLLDEKKVVERRVSLPVGRVHLADDVSDDVRTLEQLEVTTRGSDRCLVISS